MGAAHLSGFYFITDSGLTSGGVPGDVKAALAGGATLVQYREKGRAFDERLAEARKLAGLCRAAGVPLIVNDDIALARETEAGGIHLGQSDAPPGEARDALGSRAIIGVSVSTPDEAREAERAGADYVAASPVFATTTKLDTGPGVGLEGLRSIRAATPLPLAAIGGLTLELLPDVVAAGADLICAISASLAGGNVTANVRALRVAMRSS